MNEVHYHIQFDVLESMIDVDNMYAYVFEEFVCCLVIYWNNNLFVGETLCSHVDMWPRFVVVATDDLLYLINFLVLKMWECFLDFQGF